MLNPLLALGLAVLTFVLVTVLTSWWAAILPALLVLVVAFVLLARRTGRQLEAEMPRVAALLQERRVDEAKAHIVRMKQVYGRWQPMLGAQLDTQLGMIDYAMMRFDEALPQLERGRFRNWMALVCIGAVHWRRGRKDEAWKAFERAAAASRKESMVYLVWAVLRLRDGDRAAALEVLTRGTAANPKSDLLKEVHAAVANKRKVDTGRFPETWFQFFPEEMVKQMRMGGRRGAPPPGAPPQPPLPGKGKKRHWRG